MEEANKLIGAGKKHLVMGKVVEAVGALQEACGMLAKKYGDTADECGEAFFWCGKALLDLARMENSVLGNALEGVPEEDEADEGKPKDSNIESTENIDEKTRDELRVQVYDAMAEKKTEEAEKKAEEKQSEDVEKTEAADEQQKTEKVEEEKNSEANGSESTEKEDEKENGKEAEKEPAEEKPADEEKPAETEEPADKEELEDKPEEAEDGEEGEEEEEEEDDGEDVEMEGDAEGEGAAAEKDGEDEEVGNLQLAWEMLEVAKVIYKRKETKEDQLMAAQAHLKLGEVSAESGNYTQALEDFQECLKLQVNHLDSDSRLLAETHYQLGLTYSLNLQYSQAIESLNSSITAIKSRLEKLQKMLDEAEGPDALPEERKEMEELKALLPEIQEKVEDANEGLKTASITAEDGGSTSSAFPGSTAQNGDSLSSSATKGKSEKGVTSTNGQTSTAPVSDISHLVRKKRKPEESPVKESVKKVKQDDGQTDEVKETPTNGAHKANGDANGHADSMEVEGK